MLLVVAVLVGFHALGFGTVLGASAAPDAGAGAPITEAAPASTSPSPDTPARPAAGTPRRIALPAIGVSAAVEPIRLEGSTALDPPADITRVGWWADGARPGARTGTALLTGHSVHTGGGVFDDLDQLIAGDSVRLHTPRGLITYEVTSVETLGNEQVAERHRELFDQDRPGRLVLVTCADWDGARYLSSVVVTARVVQA